MINITAPKTEHLFNTINRLNKHELEELYICFNRIGNESVVAEITKVLERKHDYYVIM